MRRFVLTGARVLADALRRRGVDDRQRGRNRRHHGRNRRVAFADVHEPAYRAQVTTLIVVPAAVPARVRVASVEAHLRRPADLPSDRVEEVPHLLG